MSDENAYQAAERLKIIANDICRRFDETGFCILPIALPNSIAAARMILDRLERATEPNSDPTKETP